MDAAGVVTLCNPAAGLLFSLPPEDVVGQPADTFIPGFAMLLRRFAAGGLREMVAGADGGLSGRPRGGGAIPLRVVLSRVRAGEEEIFTAVLAEIPVLVADDDDDFDVIPLSPPVHPAR